MISGVPEGNTQWKTTTNLQRCSGTVVIAVAEPAPPGKCFARAGTGDSSLSGRRSRKRTRQGWGKDWHCHVRRNMLVAAWLIRGWPHGGMTMCQCAKPGEENWDWVWP